LQAELASVKKELEETRAKITLGATQATIQVDGVQTMEYGDEQIAARRAELEKEYQEKATAAEQRFNLRANDMRSKLSAKLAEGRTKAQEDAQLAVEQLKIEHAAELERIKADHNQQLERLRNAVPQYTADGESATGTEIPPVLDVVAAISAMTEAEAKRVVANNDTIKTIMRRNISQFVTKEKELLQEQHAKDIGQKLEEAAKAAQLAQENAVNLEAKRQSVKFTMADNKAKTAIAKIEVVEKVAAATPQRPVGEVWAEAKLAKPPVKPVPLIPAAGHAAAQASQSQTGQTPSGPVTAKPQPFGQPSSAVPAANPFAAQPAAQNQAASNVSQPSAVSSLPAKPPPSTGIPQPGAGRGRSASGSGPPGGSAIPRGGSRIGRGRGGGQRGGNQQVQTSGFQRQGGPPTSGNSPGGGKGNLNPNAKQFVAGGTGLKRPSEAGQGGNVEKRPRGEQGGQP
jgi:nucleoprotein TPR